jgi:hypothetical protein
LTAYADAVRAAGKVTDDARDALHECLRPPPPPRGDGGAGCDGDGHHGGGPGDGDHDGPPPGPPPGDADGGAKGPPPGAPPGPPPPPPDADGGAPKEGPRACIEALDTCALGTGDIATCVSTATTCLEALPHPPGPPHGGGRDH